MKHLSNNCKYIQKLQKLGLGSINYRYIVLYCEIYIDNKITDIGGYILAECLKQCSELKVLWINDNIIIKKEKIEERIKENHSNKSLFISM